MPEVSSHISILDTYLKLLSVSVGVRFTTLPDSTAVRPSADHDAPFTTDHSSPSIVKVQPPTTITAIFSPITGHIQSAYSARVSQDLSLSSRFMFNINSYDSEWTMGLEWWMRRKPRPASDEQPEPAPSEDFPTETSLSATIPQADRGASFGPIQGVLKARISTSSVRITALIDLT